MPIKRRALLTGTGAALALWSLRARASDPATAALLPLVEGPPLPPPDFTKLRAPDPHVVGVRPHRKGGVRLDVEVIGDKHVVHNYGHGGAGITLSWGTASVAADRVDALLATRPGAAVAIVGTGIAGLTTASTLRERHPALALTVYARDLDVRTTTSFIAGGQFEPSGICHEYKTAERQPELHALLRTAHKKVVALHSKDAARYGIAPRTNFTLDHEISPLDTHTPRDVVPAFQRGALPFEKLASVPGRAYRTWLMNPSILMPTLRDELTAARVQFVQRTFATRADLSALPERIVVNCTGFGARALLDDTDVTGQRGHLVVLDKTDPRQDWFFSGGCQNNVVAYVFCRQTDIIVGGTVGRSQDEPRVLPTDAPVFDRLLRNGQALFGGDPARCRR